MKTRFLTLLPLATLLFAACSSDDHEAPEVNDGRVRFTSGVTAMASPQTRMIGGNQWETTDQVGIYMVENGTTTIGEGAENVKYKANSAGASTDFEAMDAPIYYPVNSPEKVDFIAYYPYTTAVNNFEYAINVSDQSNLSAIDLLRAEADNSGAGYDKTNTSAIALTFNHKLTKLKMNVTAGDGVANLTGLTVSIKGMNTQATYDLKSATGIRDEAAPQAIEPNGLGSSFEAILLPVTALGAEHTVEFTVGTNTYVWLMANNTGGMNKLEAGKEYSFEVTLKKEKVTATGTITPWEAAGGGNVTAE